ncbi:hypothetical protein ACFL7D_02350 [candidate division KSB1 bacterium]
MNGSIDLMTFAYFAGFNLGLFLMGYLSVNFIWNMKKLAKKGYTKEHSEIVQKSNDKAGTIVLYVLPSSQLLFIFVTYFLGYDVTPIFFVKYGIVISVIILITVLFFVFVVFDKKTKEEMKQAAIDTDAEIIVDFKHKGLKLIFNMKLHLVCSILLLTANYFILNHNYTVYIYAFITWFFYSIMRKSKYQVMETIRYGYRVMAGVMIYIEVLRGFVVLGAFKNRAVPEFTDLNMYFQILLIAIAVNILTLIVLGSINFPKVNKLFPVDLKKA